jgi:signal transduction histidine kinase/ActR/RegA family two-component response regulator
MTGPNADPASLGELRARIIHHLLAAAALLGLLAYLPSAWIAHRERLWGVLAVDTIGYAIIVVLALSPRFPSRVRALGLVGVGYLVALGLLASLGPQSGGLLWLMSVPVFAALLVGARAAAWALGLQVATLAVMATIVEIVRPVRWEPHFPHLPTNETIAVVVLGINAVFLSAVFALSIITLLKGLEASIEREQESGEALRREQHRLAGTNAALSLAMRERQAADAERQTLERQLREAQKLEALGTLAGGIAHDFNNLLQPILGNAILVRDEVPANSANAQRLSDVILSAKRARDMVQRILAFSRKMDVERRPVDMVALVQETIPLIQAGLPASITIETDLKARRRTIKADPTEMHQVLMNLATNAAHAMKQRGGTLMIRLLEAPERSAVKLVVEDTGDGMTEATLERVYEPFFTTKGPGEGTGLGLAMVHGIVTSLEGQIEITSAPGAGTTVSVVLPLDRIPSTSFANTDPGMLVGETRQERVLLVDDEVSVLRIAQAVLLRLGYQVTSVDDPARALELLRTEEGAFDLLITDHSMPRMTGLELVRATRELKPDLPIIVATGYLEGGLEEDLASEGIRHILQKPYGTRDLAHIVDVVLQDNRVSAH